MKLIDKVKSWWRGKITVQTMPADAPPRGLGAVRGAVDHVIILDGTMSTLAQGRQSNAGLLYHLLTDGGARAQRDVYYEQGQQWEGLRHGMKIVMGQGVNPQILRAYGWLCSHYRAGDRIYLFGYSRGAYGVRALAGLLGRVGLLQHSYATQGNVNLAFRHYQQGGTSNAARDFARLYCHSQVRVQMLGVWDTVKAIGLRAPPLWRFAAKKHDFRDHHLGDTVIAGFHALAMDETRRAFAPEMWDSRPSPDSAAHPQILQQMWFAGAHADIGGHVGRADASRPLSNIPLVWMLDHAQRMGLDLPPDWRARYPCDVNAPMVGTWRGFGLFFIDRRRRIIGRDPSEQIHPSALARRPRYWWEF
jgi:uncharacterized protein (DUF2235 family)